jgi:hypothetical protein
MNSHVLRIAHLYPQTMNIFGGRGNIMALLRRAALRALPVTVDTLELGDTLGRGKYDIFFLGGGEEGAEKAACADLMRVKGEALLAEIEDGAACLALSESWQLFGKYFTDSAGRQCEGLGYLDMQTEKGDARSVGYALIELMEAGPDGKTHRVVGFEQHLGQTWLGKGLSPLGKVLAGRGNNGRDGYEGARYKGFIGTYLHGPLLPLNVSLCDLILAQGAAHRGIAASWEELIPPYEKAAYEEAAARALAPPVK